MTTVDKHLSKIAIRLTLSHTCRMCNKVSCPLHAEGVSLLQYGTARPQPSNIANIATIPSMLNVCAHFQTKDLGNALITHAANNGYAFTTTRSSHERFVAHCKKKYEDGAEECPFQLRATGAISRDFVVSVWMPNHTCGMHNNTRRSNQGRQWVSTVISGTVSDNNSVTPRALQASIRRHHGVTVSYQQAWRGEEQCRENIVGFCFKQILSRAEVSIRST